MTEWHPDIVVADADVDDALRDAGLDGSPARVVSRGWDNVVWQVETCDGELLVRIPVREVGVPGALRERTVLPRLAQLTLPLRIPTPITVLQASARLRWGGIAYPPVPGTESPLVDPVTVDTRRVGRRLGAFLARLHSTEALAAVDPWRELPLDPMRRGDTAFRVEGTRATFAELLPDELDSDEQDVLDSLLASALADPIVVDPDPPLLHGDLHGRHLLLVPDGSDLVGVIDLGDCCRGPRATDLPAYWLLLDEPGRAAFHDTYGDVHEHELRHARVLAAMLAGMLVASAGDVDVPGLRDGCRRQLANVLAS